MTRFIVATVCVDMRVVSVVMTAQTFDPSRGYYHDNGENHHIQLVKMVGIIHHAFCDVFGSKLCITDFGLDYMHS